MKQRFICLYSSWSEGIGKRIANAIFAHRRFPLALRNLQYAERTKICLR
jgi:hypothetical protein